MKALNAFFDPQNFFAPTADTFAIPLIVGNEQ